MLICVVAHVKGCIHRSRTATQLSAGIASAASFHKSFLTRKAATAAALIDLCLSSNEQRQAEGLLPPVCYEHTHTSNVNQHLITPPGSSQLCELLDCVGSRRGGQASMQAHRAVPSFSCLHLRNDNLPSPLSRCDH